MSKKSKKKKKGKSKRNDTNYKFKKKQKKGNNSSDTSNSSDTTNESERKNKHHKKKHKQKRDKSRTKQEETSNVPLHLMEKSKAMAPMTKDEWEKQQNIVKRVYDETTGRYRLIKGGGEILEEIVSREQHKEINKLATRGDQEYFQTKILSKIK